MVWPHLSFPVGSDQVCNAESGTLLEDIGPHKEDRAANAIHLHASHADTFMVIMHGLDWKVLKH